MAGLNELTKRLLAEGWKPEDTPPGTKEYFWFYGGWTYTREALAALTFETPCGLLVKGSHFGNGDMDQMANKDVRNAILKMRQELKTVKGLKYTKYTWNPACKGVDDYLLSCAARA